MILIVNDQAIALPLFPQVINSIKKNTNKVNALKKDGLSAALP